MTDTDIRQPGTQVTRFGARALVLKDHGNGRTTLMLADGTLNVATDTLRDVDTTILASRRAAMATGLRALADDIEAGNVPFPYEISPGAHWNTTDDGRLGPNLTPADARAAMAATPGGWAKDYTPSYVNYVKDYGGQVTFGIWLQREAVCRKVQTGTKLVPAVPAQPEHEAPVFEWVCDSDPQADAS